MTLLKGQNRYLSRLSVEFARLDAQDPETANGDNLLVDTPIEKVYSLSILDSDAIKGGGDCPDSKSWYASCGMDPTTLLCNLNGLNYC